MLTLLISNWKLVIIAILLAALGISFVYSKSLKSDINVLKSEKKTLKAELDISQESVKSLQFAINEQNTAIEKMKTDADIRETAGKKIVEKAKADALVMKRKAEEIMALTLDPNKTQCDAANDLINQEIKGEK